MKNNKGFVGVGLILAVIAVLVFGGGAYYLGTKKLVPPSVIPFSVVENDYQRTENQNDKNLNTKNIINSISFGYSILYSGIDSKNVYLENDGKNVNLFPNQSNIDNLEIVDSNYSIPSNMLLVGDVTFGINQYLKFKDSIIPRHTYYFKSGLKNNKSILISVENDSDTPNYLDLASLKIILDTEESSMETFNNQPGAIKSIIAKENNQWVLAVDLLSRNPNWIPGVDSTGGFFINQNTKIRNLYVTIDTKTYNCGEGPDGNATSADVLINTSSFLSSIKADINNNTNEFVGPTRYFDINENNIISIYEMCLP